MEDNNEHKHKNENEVDVYTNCKVVSMDNKHCQKLEENHSKENIEIVSDKEIDSQVMK